MASGKSTVARLLAEILQIELVDLDAYIAQQTGMSIPEIFQQKGEIFFRKIESQSLLELVHKPQDFVMSLGGGTPCYANNMELIKQAAHCHTIYLNASIDTLTDRLFLEKENRPLVAHFKSKEEINDFIRKHLFERKFYYNQADIQIKVDGKSESEIVSEIQEKLF